MRKVEVTPVVFGALVMITKNLDKWIEKIGIKIKVEHLKKTAILGWDSENIKEGSRDLKRTEDALVILGCLLQLDLNGTLPVYNQN